MCANYALAHLIRFWFRMKCNWPWHGSYRNRKNSNMADFVVCTELSRRNLECI